MLALRLTALILGAVQAAQIPFVDKGDRHPGAPEDIYIQQCEPPPFQFPAPSSRTI